MPVLDDGHPLDRALAFDSDAVGAVAAADAVAPVGAVAAADAVAAVDGVAAVNAVAPADAVAAVGAAQLAQAVEVGQGRHGALVSYTTQSTSVGIRSPPNPVQPESSGTQRELHG